MTPRLLLLTGPAAGDAGGVVNTCARCHDAARAHQDSYCKPCRRELTREWRARNPDRAAALAAHHNARRPRKGSRLFLRNLRATLATLEEVQS